MLDLLLVCSIYMPSFRCGFLIWAWCHALMYWIEVTYPTRFTDSFCLLRMIRSLQCPFKK
uniref:Uncharacterized protein n=1 Tax=Rhizophora mucronata TaxID=61149 RepID=A0A2P2IMN3_RHIMU